MFGSEQSIRMLRPTFQEAGIDLADHDFITVQEVLDELNHGEEVDVVLIIERMSFGVENGKYGLITQLREVDPTVRIAFCAVDQKKDHEFENWCYKYRVYDIFYPDKGGEFNVAEMAVYIRKGRLPTEPGEDTARAKSSGAAATGSGRERRNPFEQLTNRLVIKNPFRKKTQEQPVYTAAAAAETMDVESEEWEEPYIPPIAAKPLIDEFVQPEKRFEEFREVPEERPKLEPQVIIREVEKPVEVVRIVEKPVEVVKEVVKKVYVDRPVEVERKSSGGCTVLGIFNLSRGAGATRTAVDIAEHLTSIGHRSAVVALDGKSDLKYQRGKAEYIVPEEENGDTLVHFLAGSGQHRFILLDFGTLFDLSPCGRLLSYNLTGNRAKIGEFMRCQLHIGMGFTAEWHANKIKYFVETDVFSERIKSGGYVFFYDQETKVLNRRYPGLQLYHRETLSPVELVSQSLFGVEDGRGRKKRGLW